MHAINEMIILYNHLEKDDFYKNAIYQVLKNLDSIPLLSSYELAEKCFVSPATILRLSRKLGYESYTDFKLSVSMDLKEVRDNILFSFDELEWSSQYLGRGIDCVIKTLEQVRQDVPEDLITQAADALFEAEHVVFFTAVGSSFLRNLQMRLMISNKDVCIVKTVEEQKSYIAGIQPQTVIFMVEMRATEQKVYEEMYAAIRAENVKIIHVTNKLPGEASSYIDIHMGYKGSSFRRDGLGIETILAGIAIAYTNRHLGR